MSDRSGQPSADMPIESGPQPSPAVAPVSPHVEPAITVLDAPGRTLLAAVLNRLVPADGALPGAGDLEVGSAIERTLAAAPALRRLILHGMTEIRIAAHRLGGADFAELAGERQDAVLRAVEAAHPAFFAALVDHTYRGYYTLPRVLRHLEAAVGYPARPPQPLGHELPPWQDTLLARQRERAPFWRRPP